MQYLHNFLCAHHPWYAAWHKETHANAVAWTVFLFMTVLYAQALTNSVQHDTIVTMPAVQPAAVVVSTTITHEEPAVQSSSDAVNTLGALTSTVFREISSYATDGGNNGDALRGALEARRDALNSVAENDPSSARAYILVGETLTYIPEQFQAIVEQPIEITGLYRSEGNVRFVDMDDGRSYVIALTNEEADSLNSRTRIMVGGALLSSGLIVPTSLTYVTE